MSQQCHEQCCLPVFFMRMGCWRTCQQRVPLTSVFCVHVCDSLLHFYSWDYRTPWFAFDTLFSVGPVFLLESLVCPIWLSLTVLMFSPKSSLSSFKTRDAFQISEEFVFVLYQEAQKMKHWCRESCLSSLKSYHTDGFLPIKCPTKKTTVKTSQRLASNP